MNITFTKPTIKWVLETFKDIKPECFNCHKRVTVKNLGGITYKGMVCTKLVCLIALADIDKRNRKLA